MLQTEIYNKITFGTWVQSYDDKISFFLIYKTLLVRPSMSPLNLIFR